MTPSQQPPAPTLSIQVFFPTPKNRQLYVPGTTIEVWGGPWNGSVSRVVDGRLIQGWSFSTGCVLVRFTGTVWYLESVVAREG